MELLYKQFLLMIKLQDKEKLLILMAQPIKALLFLVKNREMVVLNQFSKNMKVNGIKIVNKDKGYFKFYQLAK
jgi:hypothetical protein